MAKSRRFIAGVVLGVVLSFVSFLLIRYWYQPTYSFVFTDNARIEGTRVKVFAENRGQVMRLPYDTGDDVERLQPVATIRVSTGGSNSPSDSRGLKYIYQSILAPVSGTVVSKDVAVGDMVSPGQSLVTMANLDDLWVIANVDENVVRRVRPGQQVDIHVDATGETLAGAVQFVVPGTTSIVQQPAGSSLVVAANTQDVPVRISFQHQGDFRLYPGLSVEVTIHTK
ncbi:MAG: efflux RND transporter periplasmic adaptor subunit [Chloroflexi bacterium]|nr:efflux RND transporter periplasmic adaptor subunit [Chloroflexota bacterium]